MLGVAVRDERGNCVRVRVEVHATFGEVRNAVNCGLECGFAVGENEIVPSPFSHYVRDDPELFSGPSDEWRVADVFYEAICAAISRREKVVWLRAASCVPLGPPKLLGVLFPDARDVPPQTSPIAAAARKILGRTDLGRRVEALVASLSAVETALREDDFRSLVVGVAGFGFDGEVAALVFAGSLTLEDGVRAIDATTRSEKRWRTAALVGKEFGDAVVTHHVCDKAVVVVSDDGPYHAHDLVETTAAHTPHFALPFHDADYDITPPRLPFYSRGESHHAPSLLATLRNPVLWHATCSAMEDKITEFVHVGGLDNVMRRVAKKVPVVHIDLR